MTDLKWLDGYAGQTISELLALAADHRVDSLIVAIEEALQQKAARLGNQSLSETERIVLAVEALEREVNNGGYDQFFVNSSGEYASTIVDALLQIGCPATADITRNAIASLRLADLDPRTIEAAMADDGERRAEELAQCDEAYHATAEDIAGQLFAFVNARKDSVSL